MGSHVAYCSLSGLPIVDGTRAIWVPVVDCHADHTKYTMVPIKGIYSEDSLVDSVEPNRLLDAYITKAIKDELPLDWGGEPYLKIDDDFKKAVNENGIEAIVTSMWYDVLETHSDCNVRCAIIHRGWYEWVSENIRNGKYPECGNGNARILSKLKTEFDDFMNNNPEAKYNALSNKYDSQRHWLFGCRGYQDNGITAAAPFSSPLYEDLYTAILEVHMIDTICTIVGRNLMPFTGYGLQYGNQDYIQDFCSHFREKKNQDWN